MPPLRNFALVYLGAQLLDNASLVCRGRSYRDAQLLGSCFTMAPLALRGGTGSPVNPTATF
jgi:hypothetical protein